MNCSPETVAAMDLAARAANGQHVPAEIFQGEPPATQIAFAKVANHARNDFAAEVLPHLEAKHEYDKLGPMGAVKSWAMILRDAQPVLGKGFTKQLEDALQTHWEATQGKDAEAFKRDVLPVIQDMRQEVPQFFEKNPGQANFANDWLDYWENGGKLYRKAVPTKDAGLARKVGNVIMYPVKTMAENLVVNNPFIASAHTFQVTPKAVAFYGPGATIRGSIDYLKGIGTHKLFGQDPELAARGVYRGHEGGFNLVNFGDNLAKGLAYRIGEAAGHDPLDAVQNIAYSYRLGREPMITWHTENAAQVYLMRFAIESSKMYGGWLKNVGVGLATKDAKLATSGAASLAAFSVVQSMFTGVKTAIPAPVYPLLDDDTKAMIDEWDKLPFLNVAGHATGRDFTHYQPAGGFGIGIAQNIANTDIKGAYTHTKKGVESLRDADYTRAGVEFTRGFFSGAQATIPGVRITYKKMFDVLGDAMTGEESWNDVPANMAEGLGFPAAGHK